MNKRDRLWVKFEPNKPIGKCPNCKRDVYATEHYSCPQQQCPVQIKATMRTNV